MATNPTIPVGPISETGPDTIGESKSALGLTAVPALYYHVYHAEAHLLTGDLHHPLCQPLEDFGGLVQKTRREGHHTRSVGETTVENLISFKKGYTSVSGCQLRDKADTWGHQHSGWVTLATSALDGLNVFEVITADRLIAQASTEHSLDISPEGAVRTGHVPAVTFLGTRFENLRVNGYPVEVELDLGICGGVPANGQTYLEDHGFLDRVQPQLEKLANDKGLPERLKEEYAASIKCVTGLKRGEPAGPRGHSRLKCSLVKNIKPIPIPGVKIFGHIIYIPDFGTVALGELEVSIEESCDTFADTKSKQSTQSNYFTLSMLNMRMGSIAGGSSTAGKVKVNGQTNP